MSALAAPGERAPPTPGRCTHYVLSRRRYCNWPVLAGQDLCGHHASGRVPCPLDGKHTVAVADLAAHLRICNVARHAAALASCDWLTAGLNDGGADASDDEDGAEGEAAASELWRRPMSDPGFEEARAAVRAVADAVLAATATPVLTTPLRGPEPPPACVASYVAASALATAITAAPFEARHAAQHSGILAHMARVALLPPAEDVVYVELGAGRGYLSNTLATSYAEGALLLVERRAYRWKAERHLRQAPRVRVLRLRCDVADLDLRAAPMPPPMPPRGVEDGAAHESGAAADSSKRRLVVTAKHLCGGGTDAALRCAARCSAASGDTSRSLAGLAIAPCCHHAGKWRVFCGKRTLRAAGIGPREFALAARMSSWALDASAKAQHDASVRDASDTNDAATAPTSAAPSAAAAAADERWGISSAERMGIGMAIKRLLDTARADWAAAHCGGAAELVRYCDAAVSPENRLIVLRRTAG